MLTSNPEYTNERTDQTAHSKSGFISLTDSMSSSIKSEVADLVSNVGEVGIDAALNDGVIQDMPFISTAISVFKIGRTIRERSLIEKLYRFVKEMNAGCVDEFERERRAEYFKHNRKKRSEELNYLVTVLDRYINPYRADWLSRVYLNYLENNITWNSVLIYSECIDKIILEDLYYLNYYVRLTIDSPVIHSGESIPIERLRFFKLKYIERYASFISRFSYESQKVFSPSELIKLHTDRLISAGLVELTPIPIEFVLTDGKMYQSTRAGIVFMTLLFGMDYLDNPSLFMNYYSNVHRKDLSNR